MLQITSTTTADKMATKIEEISVGAYQRIHMAGKRCPAVMRCVYTVTYSKWSCKLYLKGKVQLHLALTKETRYDNPSLISE